MANINLFMRSLMLGSMILSSTAPALAQQSNYEKDKLVLVKSVNNQQNRKQLNLELNDLEQMLIEQNVEIVSTGDAKKIINSSVLANQMSFACKDTDIRFVHNYSLETYFSDDKSQVVYDVKCNYQIRGSTDKFITQYKITTNVDGQINDLSSIYVQVQQPEQELKASTSKVIKEENANLKQLALGTVGIAASVMVAGPTGKSLFNGEDDKRKHAVMGAMISSLTTAYFLEVKKDSRMKAFLKGVAASVFVGIAKEVRDKMCKCGTPEVRDAAATAFGGVVGSLGALTLSVRF